MLVTVKRCYLYDKDFLLAARRSQTKAYAPIIYRTVVQTIADYRGGKRHENKHGKGGNVVRAHRRRKKIIGDRPVYERWDFGECIRDLPWLVYAFIWFSNPNGHFGSAPTVSFRLCSSLIGAYPYLISDGSMFFFLRVCLLFSDAGKHLCKRLCPSVSPSLKLSEGRLVC